MTISRPWSTLNLYLFTNNQNSTFRPVSVFSLPYFFGYKTEFSFFLNNSKNLDSSYKVFGIVSEG